MPFPAEPKPDNALAQATLLARRFADFLGQVAAGGGAGGFGVALPSPERMMARSEASDGRPAARGGFASPPPERMARPRNGDDGGSLSAAPGRGPGFAEQGETGWPFLPGSPPTTPLGASPSADAPRQPNAPQPPGNSGQVARPPAPEDTVRRVMEQLDLEFKRSTSLSLTEALTSLRDKLRRDGAG